MVEAQTFWKIYQTGGLKVDALRGVDLAAKKGEVLAVMILKTPWKSSSY